MVFNFLKLIILFKKNSKLCEKLLLSLSTTVVNVNITFFASDNDNNRHSLDAYDAN
jgi:hypothetical protein